MKEEISRILISDSQAVDKERKYWLNKLSGELVKNYFPYDHTTREENNEDHYRLDEIEFQLPANLSQQLQRLTNQSHRNLYVVLLAGLTVLLHKYTGNHDIIIVAPIYEQKVEGTFVNTILAIRNQLEEKNTFKELLLQVKTNLSEANEYLNYPIESIFYHLDLPAAGRGFPLSETVILLENLHSRKYVDDVEANIIFSFLETGGSIKGKLEYHRNLYKKETAQGIIAHFTNLLRALPQNLDTAVSKMDILSDREREKLLVAFNRTRAEYPREKTIHQLFEEQVEKNPDRTAVIDEAEMIGSDGVSALGHHRTSFTYRELNQWANRLARLLVQKGVKQDSIVSIVMDPSAEMLIGILAVLKAGGGYLPLDPEYLAKRTIYMFNDSQVRLLLTRAGFIDRIQWRGDIINIEDPSLYAEEGGNLPAAGSPDSLLYMIYTSGTSGKPKGVLIKHRNLVNYVSWVSGALNIGPGDRAILTSSFAFDLGYTSLYSSILKGAELHVPAPATYLFPEKLLRYIKENGISYLKMTPSFFSLIVNNPEFTLETCSRLRVVILGGEAINTMDVEHARRVCPHLQIMNHYGPTETTIGSIAQLIDFDTFDRYREVPTIGEPIANTTVYLLDKHLCPVPMGVPAELCIGGDGVGRGYLNNPGLTLEKFIDHPFRKSGKLYRTGDLARRRPGGNIEFLGRIDQQVKIRGFRIEPAEIENQLITLEPIKEAVVLAMDSGGEQYLCAYIVPYNSFDTAKIKHQLQEELPDYLIPTYFVPVDRIPLTPNGKVDRSVLPPPESGLSVTEYRPPMDAVEEKMVEIWAEILGIEKEKISTEHNFFDLGGHSLNLVMLISKIHKEFGFEIPINQVFESAVLKDIANGIKNKKFVEEPVSLLNQLTPKKLFCFPPGLAYGVSYGTLAALLMDYSFYAFNFIEEEDRIQRYVRIITRIQPTGPYVLYGYSAGGALTFQVAKALEDKGFEVSDVVLVDSFWNQGETREYSEAHVNFVNELGTTLERLGMSFVEDKVKTKVEKYFRYVINIASLEKLDANIHVVTSEEARRGKDDPEWNYLSWAELTTKSFQVYEAIGTHQEMFDPGIIEKNAVVIKQVLDSIEFASQG